MRMPSACEFRLHSQFVLIVLSMVHGVLHAMIDWVPRAKRLLSGRMCVLGVVFDPLSARQNACHRQCK